MDELSLSNRPCIIWDFDGTIADTEGYIVAAATQVLAEHGFTREQMGDVSRLVGPPYPGAFDSVYGVGKDADLEMTNRYWELYDWKNPEGHRMYDGLRDLMEQLAASGRRMAIASSKTKMRLDYCISDLGIEGLFSAVFSKGDVPSGSKPELIALAMDALGATPEECVMIGDRYYDITGAAQVGIPSIGASYGTHKEDELREANATAIAPSVSKLRKLLLGN